MAASALGIILKPSRRKECALEIFLFGHALVEPPNPARSLDSLATYGLPNFSYTSAVDSLIGTTEWHVCTAPRGSAEHHRRIGEKNQI